MRNTYGKFDVEDCGKAIRAAEDRGKAIRAAEDCGKAIRFLSLGQERNGVFASRFLSLGQERNCGEAQRNLEYGQKRNCGEAQRNLENGQENTSQEDRNQVLEYGQENTSQEDRNQVEKGYVFEGTGWFTSDPMDLPCFLQSQDSDCFLQSQDICSQESGDSHTAKKQKTAEKQKTFDLVAFNEPTRLRWDEAARLRWDEAARLRWDEAARLRWRTCPRYLPGDVVIFRQHTLHMSLRNCSTENCAKNFNNYVKLLDNVIDTIRISCDTRWQNAKEPVDPRYVVGNEDSRCERLAAAAESSASGSREAAAAAAESSGSRKKKASMAKTTSRFGLHATDDNSGAANLGEGSSANLGEGSKLKRKESESPGHIQNEKNQTRGHIQNEKNQTRTVTMKDLRKMWGI